MVAGGDLPPAPEVPSKLVDAPTRADGIQLLGSAAGSGYREPPALVRRADGQTLQLTPLLYALLERIDGRTGVEDLAEAVSAASGRGIAPGQVQQLIDRQLRPLGLVTRPDGSQPEVRQSDPLLRMRLRATIADPERTRRVTAPFAALFTPFVAVPVLLGFALVTWWVLVEKGLASSAYDAFANPGLLLLVFVLTLVSAGFHEFGHASGSMRGGAAPGRMGFGFYLIWPAFFTDVTDSYRLGRWGRLRTDLGGLYFNAIVVVLIALVWLLTRSDALLLVVATQLIMMVRQLIPVVRFDGYHILADAVGVPDLFGRIGPILRSIVPGRAAEPEAKALKPWVRVVVTAWVLVVVPLLLAMLLLVVIALPRIVGTAWQALSDQAGRMGAAWSVGDVAAVSAHLLGLVALALPLAAMGYVLVRLARQGGRWVLRSLRGGVARRITAVAAVAALAAVLALAWWPHADRYEPIDPSERGAITDAVPALLPAGSSSARGLVEGETARAVALWGEGRELPTREAPELALVLVPAGGGDDDGARAGEEAAPTWVFPFDAPGAPRPGDNQALAVNTQDGSVLYDVAFALVWADDIVDTVNEAHAYASCRDCTTVAVAFQVILIAGQADVVVPQNLAAAVNYGCIDCVTHALATQLVFTIDGELSPSTLARLEELWRELAAFAAQIQDVPLDELQGRLEDYRNRIADVLLADPAVTRGPQPTDAASASPTTPALESPEPADGESEKSGTDSGASTGAPSPTGATPTPRATQTTPSQPSSDPSPTGQIGSSPQPTPTP